MKIPFVTQTSALVAAVVLAAVASSATAWALVDLASPPGILPAVAIFAMLLLLLELKPFPSLSQPRLMVFSWAFAYALLFLIPLPYVLVICAVGLSLAQAANRIAPLKALFNVAHFQLAVATGWLVGSRFHDPLSVAYGMDVSPMWILCVLLTCGVGLLASSLLVGVVIGLHQKTRLRASIATTIADNAETDGPLLMLTPVFVVVGVHGPLLLPLLLVASWIVIHSSTRAMQNEQEASHDELTGLPNRRALHSIGGEVLQVAISRGGEMAVVQIDLDGFKEVNDQLGHKFGDSVLQIVSARLSERRRSTDHLFRMGGDEFALVLGGCDAHSARQIAHACLSEIETPMTVDGVRIAISGSLGVASCPVDGDDLAALLHKADLAMYLAKRTGTGVELYSDGNTHRLDDRVEIPAHNDFRPTARDTPTH
ncbi:MAG: GGDEF domain-containing protein [Acidimicrobiales bacterium]|nr:GGDEF domain-containing protein [Acidimicrobiales bacterium]